MKYLKCSGLRQYLRKKIGSKLLACVFLGIQILLGALFYFAVRTSYDTQAPSWSDDTLMYSRSLDTQLDQAYDTLAMMQADMIKRVNRCLKMLEVTFASASRERASDCWKLLWSQHSANTPHILEAYHKHRLLAMKQASLFCQFQVNGPIAYLPCVPKHAASQLVHELDESFVHALYTTLASSQPGLVSVLEFGGGLGTVAKHIEVLDQTESRERMTTVRWIATDVIPNIEDLTTAAPSLPSSYHPDSVAQPTVRYVAVDALREQFISLMLSDVQFALSPIVTNASLKDWFERFVAVTHKLVPSLTRWVPTSHSLAYLRSSAALEARHPYTDWVVSLFAMDRIPATYHEATVSALCRAARIGIVLGWTDDVSRCQQRVEASPQFVRETVDMGNATNIRPLSTVSTCMSPDQVMKYLEEHVQECLSPILALGSNPDGTAHVGAFKRNLVVEERLRKAASTRAFATNILVLTRDTNIR